MRQPPSVRLAVYGVAAILWTLLRCLGPIAAQEGEVRLRFAWGGNSEAPKRWSGSISVEEGSISSLQPIGLESDEPGVFLASQRRVRIIPQGKRTFDGCDLTVKARMSDMVTIELQSEGDSQSKENSKPMKTRASLLQLARDSFRQELDGHDNVLMIHRAPGDRLAVHLERDHLIFHPEEVWHLEVLPDPSLEQDGKVDLVVRMWDERSEQVEWETRHRLGRKEERPTWPRRRIQLAVPCPAQEGVYRLTITAIKAQRLASRLIPGKDPELLESRDVEFVVIEPDKKRRPLADRWSPLVSIDPANPSWWKRLPNWARWSNLPGMTPTTYGNSRPVVRSYPEGEWVELPPVRKGEEPAWQAYTLPIRVQGQPHLLELEYPADGPSNLGIHIIEPDSGGKIVSCGQNAGLVAEATFPPESDRAKRHRILFWPRSRSPLLLIANRHPSAPARYGKIILSQQQPDNSRSIEDFEAIETEDAAIPRSSPPSRLMAAYLAQPDFVKNFGAMDRLDPRSGLSVENWSTFLEGSRRLAQYLQYCGYNGVLISVAANGGALYPSEHLGASARYDMGSLAGSAADPMRKDVLELLLQIADRWQLKIIPTLQWTGPLPWLESLRHGQEPKRTGIELVGNDGGPWLATAPPENSVTSQRLIYNPLNPQVQQELAAIVGELAHRYGHHQSFAGVAIQIRVHGHMMLPGLACGFDDRTVAAFAQETETPMPLAGPERFRQRARLLLGPQRAKWQQWRADRLTALVRRLSTELRKEGDHLQLVLATEKMFSGRAARRQVRLAVAGQTTLDHVLLEHGVDLARLGNLDGVLLLRPQRLAAAATLPEQTLDMHMNRTSRIDRPLKNHSRKGGLIYHVSDRLPLPSFERQGPKLPQRSQLWLQTLGLPAGAAARRSLVTSLARSDMATFVVGGPRLSMGGTHATRDMYRTFQQLPIAATETRTTVHQPLVVRTYRESDATTVCLMNESPWPIQVNLPLNCPGETAWRTLGHQPQGGLLAAWQDGDASQGELTGGRQVWHPELRPYDLLAWRFEATNLQIGEPKVQVDPAAQQELERRISAIEKRTGNLGIHRAYQHLRNPGFELDSNGSLIEGWQTRVGISGNIALEEKIVHAGEQSVHLTSEDRSGVALQSHPFAMPSTGRLVLSVHVRAGKVEPGTQLYIALQDDGDGGTYRQFTTLDHFELSKSSSGTNQWSWYEFPVDDIPFETDKQMRVMFYLVGTGDVWIDDIELSDLRFAENERVDLVKGVYAARRAFNRGKMIDCLRLVDDYWPCYLVEHVEPVEAAPLQTARTPRQPVSKELKAAKPAQEESGFRNRIRGFMPKLWR